jgi:hypothetical protein
LAITFAIKIQKYEFKNILKILSNIAAEIRNRSKKIDDITIRNNANEGNEVVTEEYQGAINGRLNTKKRR